MQCVSNFGPDAGKKFAPVLRKYGPAPAPQKGTRTVRKRDSYIRKYGDAKLYTILQREAALASAAARLKKRSP
jgi:hypothetical protein